MSEQTKLIAFYDTVGRTILGERVEARSTDKYLVIKNPAVVHIVPNTQNGQLSLQILPLFFREFLADKTESTFWKYNRDLITESEDITFDFKLTAQYQQIFLGGTAPAPGANGPAGTQPPQNSTDVVKLFDE